MQNQGEKMFRWMCGIGLLCIFLTIPEILIGKLIFQNNTEAYDYYVLLMLCITLFIYLIISIILVVKYAKYVKEYERKRLENAKKQLTTEFKQVLLNDALETISKDSVECQAKIDIDGKIVCKIKEDDLEHEMKYESYEEFVKQFHFSED